MITLDYRDKRPIYEQIIEGIQKLIISEVFKVDEKLPSVRSLAMEMSINPNTIQRAYMQLEQEGWIYSVKGKGNFVRNAFAREQMRKIRRRLQKVFIIFHCREKRLLLRQPFLL